MKPSGIEWIGDIPDDWEVRRLKAISKLQTGNTPSTNNKNNYAETGFPWLKPDDLCGTIKESQAKVFLSPAGKLETRILPANSILLCCIGSIGKIGFVSTECASNQQITALIIKHGFWRYFLYVLRIAEEELMSLSVGNVVFILNSERLGSLKIPFPPLKTQQKIADYLDEKCGEIDVTIAKQKESIEKLKAYKQSLISETVTKGLDKSAPLKPSGIEWIGDIPDDWEVTKISRLYSIQLGKMLQPEKKSLGDTYEPYICAANLSSGTFRLDEVKYMWISEPEKDIYRLKRDDLLVTEGGDVGISSIWKDDISPCYFQNALHRVVPKKGNSNRFLHYWLIVLKSVGYIDLICNKSTIAHFTKEKFAQSLILSIPLQTQEKIADYLDSKCSQIDKYITEKQNIIQKLDAYKKSLIFECVTGKQKI